MRIGVIGGLDRKASELEARAARAGHALEFHTGRMSGPASERLRSVVSRADVVVLVTGINSHWAVLEARRLAKLAGRPLHIVRRLGFSQLDAIIDAASPHARAA